MAHQPTYRFHIVMASSLGGKSKSFTVRETSADTAATKLAEMIGDGYYAESITEVVLPGDDLIPR